MNSVQMYFLIFCLIAFIIMILWLAGVFRKPETAVSPMINKPVRQLESMADQHKKIENNKSHMVGQSDKKHFKEPFTNDLPNENVKLDDSDNYNQTIQDMALESAVVKQHKEYVTEQNKVTSTASFYPSRSDSQDVVPFVGLRRPQYIVNGKDLVDSAARSVPSEVDGKQLSKPSTLSWTSAN